MVWKYLFDSEFSQRHDIEQLREELAMETEASVGLAAAATTQLQKLAQRTVRLELVVEALIRVLEVRRVMTRDELTLMIQRIDLADGVEDGCIGPDQGLRAPACAWGGHPVNPQREVCIYCDRPLPRRPPVSSPAAVTRAVRCTRCGGTVPERDTYFTESGLVCSACFQA